MSTSIEKFRCEERTRLSYLKHRGDILKVSEELDLPLEYVRRIGEKIRKKCSRDVSYLVSTTLMEHVLSGHAQRIQYLVECLHSLKDKEESYRSLCCNTPVREIVKRRWERSFVCLKCSKDCEVKVINKLQIFDLRYRAIEMLREEDGALVGFAERMGFTDKKAPEVTKITQNVVVLGDGSEKDKQIAKELEDMSPTDRQKVRKSLERKLLESKEG